MCYPNHYCCHCGCYHCNCCGHCHHNWYQPQVVWYPQPAPMVVAPPPRVEQKIDRILELAERAEKRAKVNKKKSDRW